MPSDLPSDLPPDLPDADSPPGLTERLATRISPEADRRLRLTHVITRTPISHLIDHLLRQHLPTFPAALTEQLRGGADDER